MTAARSAQWRRGALLVLLASVFGIVTPCVAQVYAAHRVVASETPPAANSTTKNLLVNVDGLGAYGELVQTSDGRFFGAAYDGGSNGTGTIYYVPAAGSNSSLSEHPIPIYTFSASQTANPSDPLINADGAFPSGLMLGVDGYLYGVTQNGGANGSGTVFRMTAAGDLTILHTFEALDANRQNLDGANPIGKLLEAPDGSIYGVTRFGGSGGGAGGGTVFRIAPDLTFSVIYSFPTVDSSSANSVGAGPVAGLTFGTDGNLYGTAEIGGSAGYGTVFQLTPSGTLTVLHTFIPDIVAHSGPPTHDGGAPAAGLLLASDGYLYGTAAGGGGSGGMGVVFRMSQGGAYTIMHVFSANPPAPLIDGRTPRAPLIEGADGTLIGVTTAGYGFAYGTVCSLSKSGVYRMIYEFFDTGRNGVGPEWRPYSRQ